MVNPTPEEIRQRRAEIHLARGEEREAIDVLTGAEQEYLLPEDEDTAPEFRTIYEIGLPPRIAVPLERYGVMFAGDLCGWTADRLRLVKEFGNGTVKEIEVTLDGLGLTLRTASNDEVPPPLPLAIAQPESSGPVPRLTEHEVDRIFELIAMGMSQREIARKLHIVRWTVWNRLRLFKELVRGLFERGATETQVRKRIGDNRWKVWEKSLEWDATKKHDVGRAA